MKILLHICCANCAVYPVKILHEERHKFTGFWFNPNIQPHEEYKLRLESVKWLAGKWELDMIYADEAIKNPAPHPGESGEFSNENLQIPERPDRCRACYRLRLEKTAQEAQHWGYEAFSTTLLISPYQYFDDIVDIARELADTYKVCFYMKDFRQYFRQAMDYAKALGLYRQKYCGCIYSRNERAQSLKLKSQKCGEGFEL